MTRPAKTTRIGGASGCWGQSAMAVMARTKAKDANAGLATDFIPAALKPNLAEIARQSVYTKVQT